MDSKLIARTVRQAFPGRNELATAGDRLEGAALALAVVVALLAVPFAGAGGSELHARQRAQATSERETHRPVEAVLVQDAPPAVEVDDRGTVLETTPVPATWAGPEGQVLTGDVQAHFGALAGTTVRIWIDGRGGVTPPPLSPAGAALPPDPVRAHEDAPPPVGAGVAAGLTRLDRSLILAALRGRQVFTLR